MIAKDRKEEQETQIALLEYLASFWNAEAVKKIREVRENGDQHRFQSDTEFEESMVSGDYKNSPIVDAVINMRKKEAENPFSNRNQPKTKLPTDLSSIKTVLNNFNKK